jgi:hypothetical protein
MIRNSLWIVFRVISAFFAGAEAILRWSDVPAWQGVLGGPLWTIITIGLILPEILDFAAWYGPRISDRTHAKARRATLTLCGGVSGYLIYLAVGGGAPPGDHL